MQILKEIASEYPDRLAHVRYINHAANLGVSMARNSGLALAQGEYIFYVDADDWANRDMLTDLYKAAKENDADIVNCDYFCSYSTYEKYIKQSRETSPINYIKQLLSEKIHSALWTKLIKHTLYTDNEINFFNGYWEDLRASVALFYYAKKTVYLPKAYYHYVQYNENALTGEKYKMKLSDILRQTEGIIEFLESKNLRLKKHINYLKLAAKQTLLFTCEKDMFRMWLNIYPESNKYIWFYPSLPFHLRMLGGCTSLRLWPLIDLWIWMKKRHASHNG
jgi:glycosyltransferase involved in cell wall biosynthesis